MKNLLIALALASLLLGCGEDNPTVPVTPPNYHSKPNAASDARGAFIEDRFILYWKDNSDNEYGFRCSASSELPYNDGDFVSYRYLTDEIRTDTTAENETSYSTRYNIEWLRNRMEEYEADSIRFTAYVRPFNESAARADFSSWDTVLYRNP